MGMNEVCYWLKEHDRFAVMGHVSPDGDSYGSTLAMCMALRNAGKQAFVLADPVPHMYAFLPGQDMICRLENCPFEPEAVIHLDIASLDRAAYALAKPLPSLLIDHHQTNAGFDDVMLIDASASSAGEILMRLFEHAGVAIDRDMAACLFTSISTDTGSFQFSNTTAETMRYIGVLIDTGLDISRLSTLIFRRRTLARTRLTGEVLTNMFVSEDGKITVGSISLSMMEKYGAVHADTETIVNYLVEVEGVCMAALLEEGEDSVKVSLRSNEGYNAAEVAVSFGGGGHMLAAGATLHDTTLASAEEMVKKALRKAVG